jgi:hypothetical protein
MATTLALNRAKADFSSVSEMYRFCAEVMFFHLLDRKYVDAVWMGKLLEGTR